MDYAARNSYTKQGLENLQDEVFGHTLEEYITAFYRYSDLNLSADDRGVLTPLLQQAYEKRIPTLDLIEIVKQGVMA
jgi:hypothetical protein